MKTLSLTQPWATLVAIGAKKIETRSWPTRHRGLIAIHASKGFPKWARETCWEDPFDEVLRQEFGDGSWKQIDPKILPVGQVIATARVIDCVRTESIAPSLSAQECSFGDYAEGRFAWVLDVASPFATPIPAKGALGLWEWEPPAVGSQL